jgi:isopenicillin-N epimerase
MGEEFPREFDYFGTRDPSGWLAAPAAVERLVRLDPGRVRAWNHHQATQGASILTGRWGGSLPGPTNAFGSIVPVAAPARFAATAEAALALHDHLWDQHRVEVPVYPFQGRLWVRVSGQIYNEESDYCRLRDAVAAS